MNLLKRGVFHDPDIGENFRSFFSWHADKIHHGWQCVVVEAIYATIADSPLSSHGVEDHQRRNIVNPGIYLLACKVL